MTEHEQRAEELRDQWLEAMRDQNHYPSMRHELSELEARHALEDHLDNHELAGHWTDPRGAAGYRS